MRRLIDCLSYRERWLELERGTSRTDANYVICMRAEMEIQWELERVRREDHKHIITSIITRKEMRKYRGGLRSLSLYHCSQRKEVNYFLMLELMQRKSSSLFFFSLSFSFSSNLYLSFHLLLCITIAALIQLNNPFRNLPHQFKGGFSFKRLCSLCFGWHQYPIQLPDKEVATGTATDLDFHDYSQKNWVVNAKPIR